MLVVTANWGLTDGSLGGHGHASATAWLDRLRAAVVRAGWGPTGRYRPVDRLTLVLAGDTFDLMFSERWNGRARPWHGGREAREARLAVAARAVTAVRRPIATLHRWVRQGLVVPAADRRGRPVETMRARVEVDVVALAGDRDGDLATVAGGPIWRGIHLGSAWCDECRAIRHGHEFDPVRCAEGRVAHRLEARPTLGESVVVELLVPFSVALRSMPEHWEKARPTLTALAGADLGEWVPLVVKLLAASPARGRVALATAWRRAVDGWAAAVRREPPEHEAGFDAPGELGAWFATVGGPGTTGPAPAAIRWLAAAAPAAVPGRSAIFGHLSAAAIASGPVLGLGGRAPMLLVEPRPHGPLEIVDLGTRPRESAIVRVGAPATGRDSIDAA